MANLKFALIALLAVGAYQCQAANVPETPVVQLEQRDLDIFLAAQQIIKIVRNVISAVHKGIDEAKPSIDILVNQLTPELGKAVKKIIDNVLALVKKEEDRIEFMIKEVEDLLAAIKKIESCTDPSKPEIQKLVSKFEDTMLAEVRAILKNHSEPLNDIKVGAERILQRFRKLFDEEIKNVIGCIQPGKKDAKKCIDGEIEKIQKGIKSIGTDGFLLFTEAQEVIITLGMDMLTKISPVIERFLKEADPIMIKISDCIAKMK